MSTPRESDTDPNLERFATRIARGWLWYMGLWLSAAHELGRLAVTSAPLLPAASAGVALAEILALVAASGLWLRRHGGLAVGRSATTLRLAALGVAISPQIFRRALSGGTAEVVGIHAWLPAVAALLCLCLLVAWRDFGSPSLSLGVVTVWLRPGAILVAMALLGTAAALLGRFGFERTLPLLGVAMLATASAADRLSADLYGRAAGSRRWERAFATLGVALCVGLAVFSPPSSTRGFRRALETTPVFAMSDEYHELEVTTAHGQSQWLIDGELKFSSMDYPRYYEPLVHPALIRASRLACVVTFSAGLGLLEREILRYPELTRLEIVTDTALGPRAFHELGWLASASEHALDDARVVLSPREVSAWLEADGPKVDAAIVDLPDPTDYYWGKYFTRLFFKMLGERLAPGGVIAMQVTSSRRAAAILLRSAEAAGYTGMLVHAPVPTMGEWHILLASRGHLGEPVRSLPKGLRFLTPSLVPLLGLEPPSAQWPQGVPLSLLHDQTALDTLVEEAEAPPRG